MTTFTSSDRSLDRYVSEINRHPLLNRQDESALAVSLQHHHDEAAATKLIVSNLRFVVKTAHEYRGYGLKLLDLVQEGNIGLMIAVRKFDPAKGYRLVSYAVWWIRAYIQSFIMRTWSLVKVGTTQAQRKLFFRLRSERERADRALQGSERATAADLAATLKVCESDVNDMEVRLGERDFSLDAKVSEGAKNSHLDLMATNADSQETQVADAEMRATLRRTMADIVGHLNDKERFVIEHRILNDEPPTLQEIGKQLSISRERVRQIESNVIRKLRHAMFAQSSQASAA